ncbi:hypothetical protein [uncultured Piscinibacter sp.]|uniref:hypothetical protein n=1 Tax=uncultured Piscinibacter sp. TaxID=1131835 RepID=UPI002628E437|nr:hypothetical protein [uncultured Piscinibacter sp.]
MKKIALVALAALAAGTVQASDPLVQFSGAIGVDPVAGFVTDPITKQKEPVENAVLGVPPGGRGWILRKLRAEIDPDGSISAKGSGLPFTGSNAIGTRGSVGQVFATLFCSGVAHHSPIVDLDLAGNLVIKGKLGATPPSPCLSPVLLIRGTAGLQPWFAAGIPGAED